MYDAFQYPPNKRGQKSKPTRSLRGAYASRVFTKVNFKKPTRSLRGAYATSTRADKMHNVDQRAAYAEPAQAYAPAVK